MTSHSNPLPVGVRDEIFVFFLETEGLCVANSPDFIRLLQDLNIPGEYYVRKHPARPEHDEPRSVRLARELKE